MEVLFGAVIVQVLILFVMAVIILGLVRQVGVLHERVAPMGAMMNDRGPDVGEMAPVMTINDFYGASTQIAGVNIQKQLLLFVSTTCPICKKLLPIAKSFSKGEKLNIILIGDGAKEEQEKMISQYELQHMSYINSAQVGMAFHVGKLPYAILIDEDGIIRAKGLVNNREHLESLIIAEETGFGSIQSYLKSKNKIENSQLTPDNEDKIINLI